MAMAFQPRLFEDVDEQMPVTDLSQANLGTFQDSLNAPIHSWFTYPAGFSYKAVERALDFYELRPGQIILDPFMGSGTTNVVASLRGVDSVGIEAHPFVYFVAQTKLYWDFHLPALRSDIDELIRSIQHSVRSDTVSPEQLEQLYPELVRKCYSPEKLARLHLCRLALERLPDSPFRRFVRLGLTYLLRSAADVATGWPYIAPQKAKKVRNHEADIPLLLRNQLYRMWTDIQMAQVTADRIGKTHLILGDTRQPQSSLTNEVIDLAFTSPPYLNNYDYADRTRLEMYFWGEAETWSDITRTVRQRLMMSATTQINRSEYDRERLLADDLAQAAPAVARELQIKIDNLSSIRLQKGGKKSYDILVAGYFNDMLKVLQQTYRVLRPGSAFVMILGDSAPYGVYIPTHTYLGDLGQAVGFRHSKTELLRTRGNKWKDNPQRHKVPLQECILTLYK